MAMAQPLFVALHGWAHDEKQYVLDRSEPSEHIFKAYLPEIGVPSNLVFWCLLERHLPPIVAATFFGPETAARSLAEDWAARSGHALFCSAKPQRRYSKPPRTTRCIP